MTQIQTEVAQPSGGRENPGAVKAQHSGLRRAIDRIGVQNLSLVVALIILCAIIGSQNSRFFLISNIETIGTTVAIVGILAVVQTVVMLIGGLDISVGSTAGLTSVASAMVFMSSHSAGFGILVALLVGVAVGILNGVVIVYGRVNAVVATLATYAGLRGLANLISNGRAQGYTGTDSTFVFLARGAIFGIPVLILVLVVVALLVHLMLSYTDVGRNLYAMGGNPVASRLAGININRYVIGCYVLAAVVAAIAGILLTARTGSGQPTSGSQGLELQSITAAALGGVALQGGRGGIPGTILAVILLGVLQNGLTILNVNSFWQDIAQGVLLIVAVVIQQRRRGGPRAYGIPK
jgi:ribose transport system permease protein